MSKSATTGANSAHILSAKSVGSNKLGIPKHGRFISVCKWKLSKVRGIVRVLAKVALRMQVFRNISASLAMCIFAPNAAKKRKNKKYRILLQSIKIVMMIIL